MELTRYQEEQLIQQYDRFLWSVVHRFRSKMRNGYDNKEDLHSECVLVFLAHIRSCNTMDEIKKVPILNMINAMCRFVLGEQALSYPRRTSNFRQVMETVVGKADYSELDRDESKRYEPINDALDEMSFKDFYSALSPIDRKIIAMKLEGHKNREIARGLGVSDVSMTRAIQRLRRFYQLRAA